MALFVVCVIWENVTSLIKGARVWEKWALSERRYPEAQQGETRSENEKGLP